MAHDNWRISTTPSALNSASEYYNKLGESFDDVYFARAAFSKEPWSVLSTELREIAQQVAKLEAKTIADIGCGTAHWSQVIAKSTTELHLFDASIQMLAVAQSKLLQIGLLVPPRAYLCNALEDCASDFLRKRVDLAILGFVLSHYSDDEAKRIIVNSVSCAKRVLLIDSRSATPQFNSHRVFKEHFLDGRWYSIPKRYESQEHWLALLAECELEVNLLSQTAHFFSAIARQKKWQP